MTPTAIQSIAEHVQDLTESSPLVAKIIPLTTENNNGKDTKNPMMLWRGQL